MVDIGERLLNLATSGVERVVQRGINRLGEEVIDRVFGRESNDQQLQQYFRAHEQFLAQVERVGGLRIRSSLRNNAEAQRQFQVAYSEFRLAYFKALEDDYSSTPDQEKLFAAQQRLEENILTIMSEQYSTSSPTTSQQSVFDSDRSDRTVPPQQINPDSSQSPAARPQAPSSNNRVVLGENPSISPTSATTSSTTATPTPVVLTSLQSVAETPEVSPQPQVPVAPAQPVALVSQSTPDATTPAGTTSTYQRLAEDIKRGNFDEVRDLISPIAEKAGIEPDKILRQMQIKVSGGSTDSPILGAISPLQLARSLVAIAHPGSAALDEQVKALQAFWRGGAAGVEQTVAGTGRVEQIAQALHAPHLPHPSVATAVPALNVIAPFTQTPGSNSSQEDDPVYNRRSRQPRQAITPAAA
jgi:hypothetical protein